MIIYDSKTLDLIDLLRRYTVTGVNLNRMSKIAVLKRWKTELDDEILIEACEELRYQINGSTNQYEFVCNLQAFIENAKNYVHNKTHTILLKDFLDRKKIYINSYVYNKPEENEEG